MGSSSLTHMEIGGAVTGQYDNVTVTNSSSLTYGGTLEIISYGTYNVASQDGTYGLFSFTGGYNGELAAVTVDGFALSNQSGIWVGELEGAIYRFDDSTGTLAVMVPEPTALVIGMGALGLLARRKRSRR